MTASAAHKNASWLRLGQNQVPPGNLRIALSQHQIWETLVKDEPCHTYNSTYQIPTTLLLVESAACKWRSPETHMEHTQSMQFTQMGITKQESWNKTLLATLASTFCLKPGKSIWSEPAWQHCHSPSPHWVHLPTYPTNPGPIWQGDTPPPPPSWGA